MLSPQTPLVKIKPKSDTLYVSLGRAVLATGLDGFIRESEKPHGFLFGEIRLLSQYYFQVNGEDLHPNVLSNVDQHSWLGYYTTQALELFKTSTEVDEGSGQMTEESEKTLEIQVSRSIGGGLHEDIDITNYTGQFVQFEFSINLDADFVDQLEIGRKRKQFGQKSIEWIADPNMPVLRFFYQAENSYFHQGHSGIARIQRELSVSFRKYATAPKYENGKIVFKIELKPFEKWHTCVEFSPKLGARQWEPAHDCNHFYQDRSPYEALRSEFLNSSAEFKQPFVPDLGSTVISALRQAKYDLASMRLYDIDSSHQAWTVAAGLPLYTALYGRDTITASWQAGLIGPEMMRGTLSTHAFLQATGFNDWLDQQPGRMIHEAHTGPLAELNYNPLKANYGSVTSSHLYPFLVAQLWHWTGNKEEVEPYIEPALKALQWMEKFGDLDGDGFYEYQTRSEQGVRNQGWKDSPNAIVNHEGQLVDPPIAMSEEQAFAYLAKYFFAETLWWLGRKAEAKKIFRQAKELKKRFNEKFWNEKWGFFAMALGPKKEQILSLGSDAGHCLACGIIDETLIPKVADRLFREDLFSGWGIRTLSSEHPSYNPYSYHRGSVWPVESGTFCLGLTRYGLHHRTEKLARSFFEMAALYEFNRPPEVLSGHPRDEKHPFPALYPKSNSPQAWSASATFMVLQSLLGLYPYAPMNTLIVDPHLPTWLPRIQIDRLRVGKAEVQIVFYRKADGASDYKILSQRGKLRILRQPSPWSIAATTGERIKDLFGSFFR